MATFGKRCIRNTPMKISNEDIPSIIYTIALVCHQSQKKSRSDSGDGWATHLEDGNNNTTQKKALTWAREGKRKRGREED